MTWTKTNGIGTQWVTWTPTMYAVCDVANPTTQQCPGTIDGLVWNTCKYAIFNGELYGMVNFTISNTGSYPYGGTRNHWDLQLPRPVAGIQGNGAGMKKIGGGFWHADTNPDRQGKLMAIMFPHLQNNCAIQIIKTTLLSYDTWAASNLSYGDAYVTGWNNASENTNIWGETIMHTGAWSLRRLASDNSAWGGAAEAWSAPSPTLKFSLWLRYMIQ